MQVQNHRNIDKIYVLKDKYILFSGRRNKYLQNIFMKTYEKCWRIFFATFSAKFYIQNLKITK